MSPELSPFTGEEPSLPEEAWVYGSLEEKCRLWAIAMCRAARGHDWQLEIDPDDGVSLWCLRCPAGVDDVCPDGIDLLAGDFEVCPGYVLTLNCCGVHVNGKWHDGLHSYGWRGLVTVELHVETYVSMDWIGAEYDVWIEVRPR